MKTVGNIDNSLVLIFLYFLFFVFPAPFAAFGEVSPDPVIQFSSLPPNQAGVTPLVMLTLSPDHQLSTLAYNDAIDLDGNGLAETTYTDTMDYFGLFDSGKCYTYATVPDSRFVPVALATGTNRHYCSGHWSGNFLNWATMTRMDLVRKLLYGGLRTIDTPTRTVLERQYLPIDSHAFAKHYAGPDLASLTPFTGVATSPPSGSSTTSLQIPAGAATLTLATSLAAQPGDQIRVFQPGFANAHWLIGGVTAVEPGRLTLSVPESSSGGAGVIASHWTLHNLSQTGITLANLTPGDRSGNSANRSSQTNTNPPLIRVAQGDFSLWTASERWQGQWAEEQSRSREGPAGATGGLAGNGNQAHRSGLAASAADPVQAIHGLGNAGASRGEYLARVEACLPTLPGRENCRAYGNGQKPIGLLQQYGEAGQLHFGLLTGSYDRPLAGGVLRKNSAAISDEIRGADGTLVSNGRGIISTLNRLRIAGYDYQLGSSGRQDNCGRQSTGPVPAGRCSAWGNPLAEILLESVRYLAGKEPDPAYLAAAEPGSLDAALGLDQAAWVDPLSASNSCAPLHVLVISGGPASYDGDQLTGLADLLPPAVDVTAKSLTDAVGRQEGIAGSWLIGSNGLVNDGLCTAKPVGSGLGAFAGLCPEAPSQQGTYGIAGLAHRFHTEPIRTDLAVPPSRATASDLRVSTSALVLETNLPRIRIPVGERIVTLVPAHRLDRSATAAGPQGSGSLVGLKIIEQTPTEGKLYLNWQDSAIGGGDGLWGILAYAVNHDRLTITTSVVATAAGTGQGFGYVISGTSQDGAHFHSGSNAFDYPDPTGVSGCRRCQVNDPPTAVTYTATGTATGAAAGILPDPLWYAAKYGGFVDHNGNNLPDLPSEWDQVDNRTGRTGADGLPDNFLVASHPGQLEQALHQALLTIGQRPSSATAAPVVSQNASGTGVLYQAFYEPRRRDALGNEVSWIGTLQALWLDPAGYLREDNGNGLLDGYRSDRVIQLFYDQGRKKTRVRRFESRRDDRFTPFASPGQAGVPTTGESGGSVEDGASAAVVASAPDPETGHLGLSEPLTAMAAASTIVELEEVGSLWKSREPLSRLLTPEYQRPFAAPAEHGRFIKTWIDDQGAAAFNGLVDPGEWLDFSATAITAARFGSFNLASDTELRDLIDFLRGKKIDGYRSRTVDYDGDQVAEVQRLGDIVHSTPAVVGPPREGFDLIYADASYAAFKRQYRQRRQVVYVGGNDGMLHAFNGGFADAGGQGFTVAGQHHDGRSPATPHPLGAEIWAYVPMQLLPHLKWLTSPQYPHVAYVDGRPLVFDAKIFDPAHPDHPGGWGTVLVVGMRFGGGALTIDTAGNGLAAGEDPVGDDQIFSSAYVIMDITNPEAEPQLLAEIPLPDHSFTTSLPAVLTVKDRDPGRDANKWFLTFGSGPSNPEGLATATSTTTAKIFLLDLGELTRPGTASVAVPAAVPASQGGASCQRQGIGVGGSRTLIACDTGVAASFVGDPVAVDRDLDYKAEAVYFGLVGDSKADRGQLMRLAINEQADPGAWTAPLPLVVTAQPVVAGVVPAVDETGQHWLFFGTGRFFSRQDRHSTTTQSLYGIKEPADGSGIKKTSLIDVSAAEVETNGRLHGVRGLDGEPIATVEALEAEIARQDRAGWVRNLPPIEGEAGKAPATRVLDLSPLRGGVLFATVYQPGADLCTGEGATRLYGLFYKTGTASAKPAILGTETQAAIPVARAFVELGPGLAAMPSLHSSSAIGPNRVNLFSQQSTGEIIRTEAQTVYGLRSRRASWREIRGEDE